MQMDQFLSTYCMSQLVEFCDDPLIDVLARRDVQLVLYRHRPRLSYIFGAYAIENGGSGAIKGCRQTREKADAISAAALEWWASRTGALGTMSLHVEAWLQLLGDAKMIDEATLTEREAAEIFLKAHLLEEFFSTDVSGHDERSAAVDEFEQMVCRLASKKVPKKAGRLLAGKSFAATIDSFISLLFVPSLRRALKPRGYSVPVADDIKGATGFQPEAAAEEDDEDVDGVAAAPSGRGRRGKRASVQVDPPLDVNAQLLATLAKVDIFKDMPAEDLERLKASMVEMTFAEGDLVFEQGEEGDAFYVILSGTASVIHSDEDTNEGETILAELKEGSFFGERALLKSETRFASVKATAKLRTMALTRLMFERLNLQELVPDKYKE